jgi:hypothetical protein
MKKVNSEELFNIAVVINVYVALFVVVDPKLACVLDIRLNMSIYFASAQLGYVGSWTP